MRLAGNVVRVKQKIHIGKPGGRSHSEDLDTDGKVMQCFSNTLGDSSGSAHEQVTGT